MRSVTSHGVESSGQRRIYVCLHTSTRLARRACFTSLNSVKLPFPFVLVGLVLSFVPLI
jgi:hypothetical protein